MSARTAHAVEPSQVVEPKWLTPDEQSAWRGFVETYIDLVAALEADLAATGLTLGDYQVLVYLSESPDQALRMCDLAQRLQLSPSGLTRRLDGLVRSGVVARVPSAADRRVMLAVITESGMQTLEDAAPVHVESVRRRLIDLVDTSELAVLRTIFDKVRIALAAE